MNATCVLIPACLCPAGRPPVPVPRRPHRTFTIQRYNVYSGIGYIEQQCYFSLRVPVPVDCGIGIGIKILSIMCLTYNRQPAATSIKCYFTCRSPNLYLYLYYNQTGWQRLVGFRRAQINPSELSQSAYLQLSQQKHCFLQLRKYLQFLAFVESSTKARWLSLKALRMQDDFHSKPCESLSKSA